MNTSQTNCLEPEGRRDQYRQWLVASILLAGLLLVVYSPSFGAPFIFDDKVNIIENRSIQSLWPLWDSMHPPVDSGLVGRPVVNLTLALNYAWSGIAPWSYHLVNFLIHLGATFFLWGLLYELANQRQHLLGVPAEMGWAIPWACALLWGLHPLNTQAVTYVIQRCESLMGLLFLASVYAYVRSWGRKRALFWQGVGLTAFLACLGCKEVAVMLLPVSLTMAWVLLGKNPLEAFRFSPFYFVGMVVALVLLFLGMAFNIGYSTHTGHLLSSRLPYMLAQGPILLRYIRLAFWPSDLTLDYGWSLDSPQNNWLGAGIVVVLVGGVLFLLLRRHWIGLLGTCFFLILAPTSLVPLPDPIFEHRMYLPSILVVVLSVYGVFSLARTKGHFISGIYFERAMLVGFMVLSITLGWRTYRRNQDYKSAYSIWFDTLQKRPNNFRAYHGLGGVFSQEQDWAGALPLLRRARELNPVSFSVRNDLGITFIQLQRPMEAIPELEEAIKFLPTSAVAHNNLGVAFLMIGDSQRAIREFQVALNLKPDYISPKKNLDLIFKSTK